MNDWPRAIRPFSELPPKLREACELLDRAGNLIAEGLTQWQHEDAHTKHEVAMALGDAHHARFSIKRACDIEAMRAENIAAAQAQSTVSQSASVEGASALEPSQRQSPVL